MNAYAEFETAVASTDPCDMEALTNLFTRHAAMVSACASVTEAASLYRLSQSLEAKVRLGRAKLIAEKEDLFRTGFLLRAFAADLPRTEIAGTQVSLDA